MLIAIDHGNKQMKSVHCPPFVSGLAQSNTEPYGREILRYGDFFYTLSDQRIPYHKDKSEDDRFFILTLFAIAAEIEAQGCYEEGLIRLAIGVPPSYYGSQGKSLVNYFKDRSVVQFLYKRKKYAIYIEDVRCYPQAYVAAATLLQSLVESPRALILDIGGHTADYIVMRNGPPAQALDRAVIEEIVLEILKKQDVGTHRGEKEKKTIITLIVISIWLCL